MQTALILCFHLKKTAAESCQSLQEAYGDHAPLQHICKQCFEHFKSVADKEHRKLPKKYYELLKRGEMVDTKRYQQQLTNFAARKNPEYRKRQHKVISHHDIWQNQYALHWKHSAGKFYPMLLTHQTYLKCFRDHRYLSQSEESKCI